MRGLGIGNADPLSRFRAVTVTSATKGAVEAEVVEAVEVAATGAEERVPTGAGLVPAMARAEV